MIKVFDNKVPYDTMQQIYDFVCKSQYNLGWSDSSFEKWSPNIHSNWTKDDVKNSMLFDCIKKLDDEEGLNLNIDDNFYKCVVNLSKSNDYHFCHTHPNQMVILYYVNLEWHDGFGGETLFYNEKLTDAIQVSSFVPGRFIVFDGQIPHTIRAQSSYGPDFRFTISYFVDVNK
jgi:hypothetical protein